MERLLHWVIVGFLAANLSLLIVNHLRHKGFERAVTQVDEIAAASSGWQPVVAKLDSLTVRILGIEVVVDSILRR